MKKKKRLYSHFNIAKMMAHCESKGYDPSKPHEIRRRNLRHDRLIRLALALDSELKRTGNYF